MNIQDPESPIGYFAGKCADNNVISYLERHRWAFPDRTALLWTEAAAPADLGLGHHWDYQSISYGQFANDIDHVAQGLLELGLVAADRVVVFLPLGVDLYTAMFAVQRIGAYAVFLDSWARRNHLGTCAQCVQPTAIISFTEALRMMQSLPEFSTRRVSIATDPSDLADATLDELRQVPAAAPICPVASETTALITFTTGSSGRPKGANRTHRFLSAQHRALTEVIPYLAGDSDLPAFPIFALNNFASGVTTVLPAIDLARPTEHDGAVLAQQIAQGQLSCATLSPAMFNAVSAHCLQSGQQLNSLRRVVTGGAPISPANIRDFLSIAPQSQPLVLYGATEVEPMAEISGAKLLEKGAAGPVSRAEGVCVGQPHHALRVKFIRIIKDPIEFRDWRSLEIPRGEVGEIIVSGDHVCRDYYNDPEAFRRAKILEPDGTAWHRTGDLGWQDEGDNLWIAGRVHNVICRQGQYLFPVRAEILLHSIAGVKRSAYLGMPDSEMGERAAAVVVLAPDTALPALIAAVSDIFKQHSLPLDSLYLLPQLPLDPRHHSKIEYELLREILQQEQPQDWLCPPLS